jgi:hypothetical protein
MIQILFPELNNLSKISSLSIYFCRQIIIAIVWAIIACNKASRAEAASVYVQPVQPQPQPAVTYVTTTVPFKLKFLFFILSMHSLMSH